MNKRFFTPTRGRLSVHLRVFRTNAALRIRHQFLRIKHQLESSTDDTFEFRSGGGYGMHSSPARSPLRRSALRRASHGLTLNLRIGAHQ